MQVETRLHRSILGVGSMHASNTIARASSFDSSASYTSTILISVKVGCYYAWLIVVVMATPQKASRKLVSGR